MWYDSKHVEILWPKEWYNAVASQYKESHQHLNSFYHVEFLRFLPRWKTFRIVDLGAWDGRMFSVLNSLPHSWITACDISEKMLEKYPKEAKKQIVDLEWRFPFEDDSFDLAFCFFTLEQMMVRFLLVIFFREENLNELLTKWNSKSSNTNVQQKILKKLWKNHFLM